MTLVLDEVALSVSGRELVRNVSLKVDTGDVIGLLGPNGAGKTTTFNLIVGLMKPDSGSILFDGKSVAGLPMTSRARIGIGYLPQEASIFRKLSVKQNLDMALAQSDLSPSLRRIRREELVEEFNLGPFLYRPGYQLSGGERRRSEVARALAVGKIGPKYLLLDEPFAGIDPLAVIDLQELIQKLKNKGVGILITDHNVRETLAITDRSYILSEGKILSFGTSAELANDPIVRQHYLGDDFRL